MARYIERNATLLKRVGDEIVLLKPYTSISQVEGGVASINAVLPDDNGNVVLDVVSSDQVDTKISEAVTAIPGEEIEALFAE